MKDFFVSYTGKDKEWAEWVASVLLSKSFSVVLQAWDFRPGSDFIQEMQRATTESKRTLLILSPDYLNSAFAAPEWGAAFVDDPQGFKRKLLPVMVRDCEPKGLLKPIVYIRLVGLNEAAARSTLVEGISETSIQPSQPPKFPGAQR